MSAARAASMACLVVLASPGCGSTPAPRGPSAGSQQVVAGTSTAPDAATQAPAAPAEAIDTATGLPQEPLPPAAVQQFDQAVVHMSAGDTAAAEQAFRALAQAYPAYAGALLNLGILYAKAGRLPEAEQALRGALERDVNNATAFNQLGIIYRKLGRFKEAEAAYQRAVQIDPNYALAYLNLGVLCDLYLQQPQRALEAYERYLALAGTADAKVTGWINELKKRLGSGEPRAARVD